MAPQLGADTLVYLGGANVTSYLQMAGYKIDVPEVQSTSFGKHAHTYIAGIAKFMNSLKGHFDSNANSPNAVAWNALALTGLSRASCLYSVFTGDGLVGDTGFGGYIVNTSLSSDESVDAIVTTEIAGTSITAFDMLQLLLRMQTVTGSGTGGYLTQVTDPDGQGTVAHLHVESSDGSATIKIQHKDSGDDPITGWVDLFTWNIDSGIAQDRAITTTAVKDMLRVQWTLGTATAVTLGLGIGYGTANIMGLVPGMWMIPGIYLYSVGYALT